MRKGMGCRVLVHAARCGKVASGAHLHVQRLAFQRRRCMVRLTDLDVHYTATF